MSLGEKKNVGIPLLAGRHFSEDTLIILLTFIGIGMVLLKMRPVKENVKFMLGTQEDNASKR